jgi:hypothetical protein
LQRRPVSVSLDFVPSDGAIDYIKAMIDWADADRRQVYIRVTAALGIVALFVTQIPLGQLRGLHRTSTLELFTGLGCLIFAAAMYFLFVDRTHLARREMARLLKSPASGDPESILQQIEKTWGWALWLGNGAFAAGVVLVALVLYTLIA